MYFAYFHSIVSYGIIIWGNWSYSRKIFTLQKKIIRSMMCAHHRIHVESYLEIRGLNSPKPIYILIDEFFFIGNQDKFLTNSSVHSISTRNKHHLHRPIANILLGDQNFCMYVCVYYQ